MQSVRSDAVAECLQEFELSRMTVQIGVKLDQARIDACFVQKVSLVFGPLVTLASPM